MEQITVVSEFALVEGWGCHDEDFVVFELEEEDVAREILLCRKGGCI